MIAPTLRRATRPPAIASSSVLVGRRSRAALRAFSAAICRLAGWVSSRQCRRMSPPDGSTTAMATVQPRASAKASAADAIVLAASRVSTRTSRRWSDTRPPERLPRGGREQQRDRQAQRGEGGEEKHLKAAGPKPLQVVPLENDHGQETGDQPE